MGGPILGGWVLGATLLNETVGPASVLVTSLAVAASLEPRTTQVDQAQYLHTRV